MSDYPDNGQQLDQNARLARLAEAMNVFLWYRAHDGTDPASILSEHAHLRDILEPMLAEENLAATVDEQTPDELVGPGLCLGDYRLEREVGRGGMGTVFEAVQISLGRRVALKLLHDRLTWSSSAIERFRREAAAASSLHHPGIVPIYEVGEWRGRHYFTMEFLEGRPLSEVMHRPRLGVRGDCTRSVEAAELVASVADALQHAHDHGLIHRDVKPHNIMIGRDGIARLLDFGLVKHDESSTDSATREFLGTPHYSSPEQVTGEAVGPHSDVFSLGIVLYELLAGRRPFEGDTTHQVLRKVEIGDFEPLTRVARGTPRDLQTICGKAMEAQPANRYRTAGEMAADLRRFLRIEPVLAKPPGVTVRVSKWLRRHRLRVALGSAVALLVVGTPTAYAVHLHRTGKVIENERRTLDEAEKLAFKSIEQTLTMLAEDLASQPGPGSKKQPRVDAVVKLCEDFLAMRAAEPARSLRAAAAYHLIGHINLQLDNPGGALQACRRALELLDQTGAATDIGRRKELRGRLLRQDLRARQSLNPETAEEEFERAISHWQTIATEADASTDLVVEYGETMIIRARGLAELPQRRSEAEGLLRRALTALTPEHRENERRAEAAHIRATNTLGHVLLWSGRTEEAKTAFEEVLSRIEAMPQNELLAVERSLALAAVGQAQIQLGQRDAGEKSMRGAIAETKRLAAEYPGVVHLRRALLGSRVQLAELLLTRGRPADAEALLRSTGVEAAVSGEERWMDRALAADRDAQLANCLLMQRGSDHDEAKRLLESALSLLVRLADEQPDNTGFHLDMGAALSNLAALANEVGDHDSAREHAERAIACQERVLELAPGHRRATTFLGIHHGQLAMALAHVGAPEEAVAAAAAATRFVPDHLATLQQSALAATMAAQESADPEHGEVAVTALQRIAKINKAHARTLLTSRHFDSLRERSDFAALAQRVNDR